MDLEGTVRALAREARSCNERRVLVLAGERDRAVERLPAVLESASYDRDAISVVSPREDLPYDRCGPRRVTELLGRTREVVVLDAHDEFRPNALGGATGAVDGGGLLVLLTPPLRAWPSRRDRFDEGLAVPPFALDAVTGRFRERLVGTLRAHPGIAIADLDADRLHRDGLTDPAPRIDAPPAEPESGDRFPAPLYDRCRTGDQRRVLAGLEALSEAETAAVIEADRGRGKSSVLGLAAAGLAAEGESVLVTGPGFRNVREVLARASEVAGNDPPGSTGTDVPRRVDLGDGSVRFVPSEALDPDGGDDLLAGEAEVLLVDEAAALPVRALVATLAVDRVAYATTVHGYEGSGRGFDVRFRDRLSAADHDVHEFTLTEPIRYAPGDPIEVWSFRALGLDAAPPATELIADAAPETVSYGRLEPPELLADEHLLRELFGLLVLAHYRTEPNDLARLLDAPNLSVHALRHEGHVVSVALLAREGGLDADTRSEMYEGGRIPGNMLPDVLTGQLRDEAAAEPVGYRVVRIATHHAVRSRGLGSALLSAIEARLTGTEPTPNWLGVGYGATPALLRFWAANGYGTVHVSTTRNDGSGEYSALMLRPLTAAGRTLHDRTAARFLRRIPAVAADKLADAEADTLAAAIRTTDGEAPLELTDWERRVVADAAFGPGLFDVAPGPFARLVVRALADGVALDERDRRLLVRRALQGWDWASVRDDCGFHGTGETMRTFGRALRPLVDRYAPEAADRARDRFEP